MANQVATGAGNAFAYGTGAGGSLRMAYLVIAIAEWLCVTRTAPHCDRGSLRMANQVATGAGNAFA